MSEKRPHRSSEAVTPFSAAVQSPLGDHLVFLLAQLKHSFQVHIVETLRGFELDLRQYSTLAFLSGGHRPTQHQLARVLRLDPSQIVALTKRLEARGLINRETSENDRRARELSATTEGQRLYLQASSEVQRIESELTASLSRRDRHALKSLLNRILPQH